MDFIVAFITGFITGRLSCLVVVVPGLNFQKVLARTASTPLPFPPRPKVP